MKNTLVIQGGRPLEGVITVQGAKNEALQILSAVLLYPGRTFVSNIPNILDIQELMNILKFLGVVITEDQKKEGSFTFDATHVDPGKMKTQEFREISSRLRGSLMIAGAMLGRFGYAYMPTPGGDKIGIRPVTTHLKAFQGLGATFLEEDGYYKIELSKNSLIDKKRIQLSEASVTGTANILLASVFSKNNCCSFEIFNAACEPYVQNLCKLLKMYGANIEGIGSNLLKVQQQPFLVSLKEDPMRHEISPDMIELGSLITLAVVCGNGIDIDIKGHLATNVLGETASEIFQKLGVCFEQKKNDILHVPYHEKYSIVKPSASGKEIRTIYDQIWPGLSPDHISSLITLAVFAEGPLVIEQRMFEERLHFVGTLRSMGAQIVSATNKLVTTFGNGKKTPLRGITMSSPDIRAGMALLIAALAAEGTSVINNASQIHRGYENLIDRLQTLGAVITEE